MGAAAAFVYGTSRALAQRRNILRASNKRSYLLSAEIAPDRLSADGMVTNDTTKALI